MLGLIDLDKKRSNKKTFCNSMRCPFGNAGGQATIFNFQLYQHVPIAQVT